ncbi:hypothetical protein VPH35_123368 [Triticum aestivum]
MGGSGAASSGLPGLAELFGRAGPLGRGCGVPRPAWCRFGLLGTPGCGLCMVRVVLPGAVRSATSSQTRLVERGGLQWFLQPVVVGGGVLLCVLGHVAWARTVGMLPETVCWAGCGEDGLGELRAKA